MSSFALICSVFFLITLAQRRDDITDIGPAYNAACDVL